MRPTELPGFKELPDRLKALLATDGSVTALLEAFTGGPVQLVGMRQGPQDAGVRDAYLLRILSGERLNRREVFLVDQRGRKLEYAVSLTPLSRLSPQSRDDVLHTDLPIGKILASHGLESRREILNAGFTLDEDVLSLLGVREGVAVPWREYLIIHHAHPLMKVIEYFGEV